MKIEPSKIERFYNLYEFTTPVLLCASDCESFTIEQVLAFEENAKEKFLKLHLGYTETKGNPTLLNEIENVTDFHQGSTIVFAGAEEGIFTAMHALLSPGDHVIVQYPCYQSQIAVPESMGCEVSLWKMEYSEAWKPDMMELKGMIRPNTKLITITNPHNPTGYLMSLEELKQIIEIADQNDIYIFSDEVYRFSEYDPSKKLPVVAREYNRGISLGVMSKAYGLPGLRIGWLQCKDSRLFASMEEIKDYITICNSAPSEFLAEVALRNLDMIMNRNLTIINENLEALELFLDKFSNQFEWVKPLAGPVSLVKVSPDLNIENLTHDLRETKGLLIMPGPIFDFGQEYFRIGFGRDNFQVGLDLLEEYIEES